MPTLFHHLAEINAFVRAVELGSFTLAGKALGLTRSAIGKRITRLETELNTRLLQRSTRSLSLTEEGQLFYDRCLLILRELDEVKTTLAERQDKPTGTLRISVPITLGKQFVSRAISDYLQAFPDMQVDLIMVDRYVDLIAEQVDLVIRIGVPNPKSELITRRIGTYKMKTVASPDYLAKRSLPQQSAELAQHFLIGFTLDKEILPWQFKENQELVTFIPQSSQLKMRVDNEEMLIYFAKQGLGITQVVDFLAQPFIDSGELVSVLDNYQAEGYPIFAVYPSKKQLSLKVKCFLERLRLE